jgi:hypothetical protein
MIGPFTTAPGGFTHVLVAIDKFTKWIKYKPIAKLTQIGLLTSSLISCIALASQYHHHGPGIKLHGYLVLGVL